MSSDGNLGPGWLTREIERAREGERTWRTAFEWATSINTAEQRSSQAAYQGTAEWLRRHGFSIRELHFAAQDNRCMDTVARSMVSESKHLDCVQVDDIPFGEYEFSYQGETVRFTVSCCTIVNGERLVHIVWDGSPCLGIIRMSQPGRSSSIKLHCRYGHVSMNANSVKIISQYISRLVPTSHVRRVEL